MNALSHRLLMLCERFSGLLYHATSLARAEKILQSNRLKAGKEASGREPRPQYVAFSRNRNYWYAPLYHPIRFIVDGTKLAQRVRLRPYALTGFEKTSGHFQYEVYTDRDVAPISRYLKGIEISTKNLYSQDEIAHVVRLLRRYTTVPIYVHKKAKPINLDDDELDLEALMGLEDDRLATADYHTFLQAL